MLKKGLIWTVWLGGCFVTGCVVGKLFTKGLEWTTEKLAECDD